MDILAPTPPPIPVGPYWQELSRNHPFRVEMERWNRPNKPYEHFPLMVYRARKRPDGMVAVTDTRDQCCTEPGQPVVPGAAEQWSRGNYMEVRDEQEFSRAMEAGWRPSPKEAMEFFHARETALADLAANRSYNDRNMSDAAKREAREAEGDGAEHVPEIKAKPVRRSGRR